MAGEQYNTFGFCRTQIIFSTELHEQTHFLHLHIFINRPLQIVASNQKEESTTSNLAIYSHETSQDNMSEALNRQSITCIGIQVHIKLH